MLGMIFWSGPGGSKCPSRIRTLKSLLMRASMSATVMTPLASADCALPPTNLVQYTRHTLAPVRGCHIGGFFFAWLCTLTPALYAQLMPWSHGAMEPWSVRACGDAGNTTDKAH